MTFEEIFNEDGLYASESFIKGVAFKITNGNLNIVHYKHQDDLFPSEEPAYVYKNLFKKDYYKVFTRQSLF